MAAYTINGAYQISFDDVIGSFEPGKSADFVILDKDLESLPTDEIETASIKSVIIRGKIID